ncbi:MAG TPA: hypothetical protein VML00_07455, partial [Bacteroidota bacterium]|nr:hypothetical protein [Bacteroidota bacterium]
PQYPGEYPAGKYPRDVHRGALMTRSRATGIALCMLACAVRPGAQTVIRINQLGYTPLARRGCAFGTLAEAESGQRTRGKER